VLNIWQPAYAASADPRSGYLLFAREGALMAQPFDNRSLKLKGRASIVADQIDLSGGVGGYGAYTSSANDVLAFRAGSASDYQLHWLDRDGHSLGNAGEPDTAYQSLVLSPDGTQLAAKKASAPDASSIWVRDLTRGGTSTRLTFGSAMDTNPVWSPDAKRIVFS
jgi:hypothetical protein